MSPRTRVLTQALSAVLLGVVWGFFVAFNAVFSDVFGTTAYVQAMFYVLGAYALLGIAFGLVWPERSWRWAVWLTPPAAVMLVLYTFSEAGTAGWNLTVLALCVAGAALGGLAGAGLRTGRPRG